MKDILLKIGKAAFPLALLFPVEAVAQRASCAERGPIVDSLKKKYGETRQSMGLNQTNGVVEIFASPETGTWTILVTMPNGMSCLMAAGKSWEAMEAEEDIGDPA